MFRRTVGLTALVLAAEAFVLPPDVGRASDLAFSEFTAHSHTITIPCSECAFPYPQEHIEDVSETEQDFWIQGGANSISLDFTVSTDGKRLQLGGKDIYPLDIDHAIASLGQKTYVDQVPSFASYADIKSDGVRSAKLEVTGLGITVSSPEVAGPSVGSAFAVACQIWSLENQPVHLDTAEVTLVKADTGELLILDVQLLPKNGVGLDGPPLTLPPPTESGIHKDCEMLPPPICKLKNIIKNKLDRIRHGKPPRKGGCRGSKGQHGTPPTFDAQHWKGEGHPHHERPHERHHGHRFLHAFVHNLVAVLSPVLAGVTVGLCVSMAGLLVGRFIGYLVFGRLRRSNGRYAGVDQEDSAVEAGEDKPFVAEMEAPPVYEAAPAYEDVIGKE